MVGITNYSQVGGYRQNFGNVTNTKRPQVKQPATGYTLPKTMLHGKPEKKSSNLGWWIAGGTVLLGIGAMLLKRRMNWNKIKPLAEHIEFKPAQTIDEARAFAKKNFGIRKFDVDDLEVANFINNGFSEATNIAKGKIVLPNVVRSTNKLDAAAMVRRNLFGDRIMDYNPSEFSGASMKKVFADFESIIGTDNPKLSQYLSNLKTAYQNGNFAKRVEIYEQLRAVRLQYRGTGNKYHTLFHELGHMQHEWQNTNLFLQSCKPFASEAEKKIAGKVSSYAKEDGAEFVAEVFADLMSGKTYSDDVMQLYAKYGGPKIGVI